MDFALESEIMSMPEKAFDPKAFVSLRKQRGFTQRSLAAGAGVSQALIAELERGKHPPSKASSEKLARALTCDESDFLN